MENIDILKEALISRLTSEKDIFKESGFYKNLPDFELLPIDYLEFADQELKMLNEDPSCVRTKINCILHLKRALSCQLDVFFHVFSLRKYVQKHNLGINKQLQFLKDIGIIKSRVINRFNKLRNKIEHDYNIPDIDDVEVYFDLISSLIDQVETTIYSLGNIGGTRLHGFKNEECLEINYERLPIPKFSFEIENELGNFKGQADIENDLKNFTLLFKVLVFVSKEGSVTKYEKLLESF